MMMCVCVCVCAAEQAGADRRDRKQHVCGRFKNQLLRLIFEAECSWLVWKKGNVYNYDERQKMVPIECIGVTRSVLRTGTGAIMNWKEFPEQLLEEFQKELQRNS